MFYGKCYENFQDSYIEKNIWLNISRHKIINHVR